MLKAFIALVDANQVGGWVRALVASSFGAGGGFLVGPLAGFTDPTAQIAVGVVASTLAVGTWSWAAKKIAGS